MSDANGRKSFTPRLPESWRSKVSEQEWENACQQDCIDQKLDHVMQAQVESASAREKILGILEAHTKDVFPKHESKDLTEFSAIRAELAACRSSLSPTVERVDHWARWLDFFFSRSGVLVGVLTVVVVPLLVNLVTAAFKSKLDATHATHPATTNSPAYK